jgi:hypothetical protein
MFNGIKNRDDLVPSPTEYGHWTDHVIYQLSRSEEITQRMKMQENRLRNTFVSDF